MKKAFILVVVIALSALVAQTMMAQSADMSFFLTSKGSGDGANLGGLAGADAHCTALAEAAGVTGKTWRAYLSTTDSGSVTAKDRIGTCPWPPVKRRVTWRRTLACAPPPWCSS